MSWFLAPSLVKLRDEVNERWPNRDKASDGAVGDTSHSARVSSHNPLWSAPGNWSGVVRAVDIDGNGKVGERTPLVDAVLDATLGDPRVWYVIWNRSIWSRTHGWQRRYYDGVNAHDKHVHVSLREDAAAWGDTRPWLEEAAPVTNPPTYRPFPRSDSVFWNMKVGRRPGVRAVLDALAASGCRNICLNECGGHWSVIRAWAKARGWSIITGEGDVGSASAILVKHHSGHIDSGTKTIDIPWKGPKGKTIPGRVLIWEKAHVGDRRVLTIDMHQVWGPNRESNDDTKRAVAETVRRWADLNPGWDIYAGADHNEDRHARTPFSPLGTANYIDGRILPGGHGVDYIIHRPALKPAAGTRPSVPRVKVGGKYDSDHPALGVTY